MKHNNIITNDHGHTHYDASTGRQIPDSWRDARALGYKVTYTALQRGYVSRRIDVDDQPIMIAGGHRRGRLYYLAPSWQSTQYCRRVYIDKAV